MSLREIIEKLIFGGEKSAPEMHLEAEERLIDYLTGLINRSDLIADDLAERKHIGALPKRDKEFAYARLYLHLENFLLSNKPLVTKKEFKTAQELRADVSQHITTADLSEPIRLLFYPENEQAAHLFNIALPELIAYTRHNLGDTTVSAILASATRSTLLDSVTVDSDAFALDGAAEKIRTASRAEITVAFRKVYTELLNKMVEVLGKQSTAPVAQKIYATIASTFDQQLLSLFLDIIPDGFLDSQKLNVLSKDELEKRVVEATQKLQQLNEQLEEKVQARTKELTEANTRLQGLDKDKTEFISIAAHQLRTPATRIRWFLSIAMKDSSGLPRAFIKQLSDVARSSDQLINLINNLLDISRIEQGAWGIQMSRQPYDTLVRDVFNDFKPAAKAKRIQYTLSLPPDIPAMDLDKDRILMVLNNLLDNAIKYTDQGGSVAVEIAHDADSVVTTVTDTGIGIPESESHRIFSKFFRSTEAQLLHTNGTGLGLFVAKKIIEYHHGTIQFESNRGKGTTFKIFLPTPKR